MAICAIAVSDPFAGGRYRTCGNWAYEEFGDLPVCHVHQRKLERAAFGMLHRRTTVLELLRYLDWSDPVVRRELVDNLRIFDEEQLAELKQHEHRMVRRTIRHQTKVTEENSVIYYVRRAGHIKIGYTTNLKKRLVALSRGGDKRPESVGIGPVELLHTHVGGPTAEAQLHNRFRRYHVTGEWFTASAELLAHIGRLKNRADNRTAAAA